MQSQLTVAPANERLPAEAAGPVDSRLGSVAIVHDCLNQAGGAERVVLAMSRIWPDAPIYTSLYRADSTFAAFGAADVRTTPLQWLPVDRGSRNLSPLYSAAMRSFGSLEHDVVISSSSGWAHSVRTAASSYHAVYCHAPAIWIDDGAQLAEMRRKATRVLANAVRRDRDAARGPHLYIADSDEVRRRLRRRYGVDAHVVRPPVEVDQLRPSERGERLLVVSRLLPRKRVELIVDAATRSGIGLDVVGTGPSLGALRRRAGRNVKFHGDLSELEVRSLIQSCRALCVPDDQDFGVTAVQANAAGKPVVASAAGDAVAMVEEGVNGALFSRYDCDAVLAAITRCDAIDKSPEAIAATARRYGRPAFEAGLLDVLSAGLRAHRERLGYGGDVRLRREPLGFPAHPQASTTLDIARAAPRPLMLGKGWFPHQVGGLDRYYRDLIEHLPEAAGVVIGADGGVAAPAIGVSEHERPLGRRLLAFWRAAVEASERADVIDVHFALYALAPLLSGKLRNTPVLLHFHGPWADENVAAGDPSSSRRLARRLLERAVYRRADEAIVLSSAFRQVLVERYGVSPWAINVVPPGVDLDRFCPGSMRDARERLQLDPDAFVVVAVRRLMPRMGLEVLVDAWRDAVEQLPPGSSLLIAGDGPSRGSLSDALARHGLEDSVRLLGRVDEQRLIELYRAADLAVVPSLDHEGFGLVALEAAACGTPSIVTATGGLPEAIHGLDASLVVPAGDPDSLRERLVAAQVRRPSRAAARSHAERFNWPTVAERHREIMRRTAARSDGDERLRVVYLDHVAQMSGGEIALLRLLPHLERVNPHVVLASDGPLVGELHLAGISTEVLPMGDHARELRKGEVRGGGVSPGAAGAAAAYVLRLAARLRQLQPDLVHANSLKAGVYGSAAARLAGVPLIWHVRDRIAEDYLPRPAVKLVRGMTRQLAAAVVANSHATLDTIATAEKSSAVVYSVLPEVVSSGSARKRQTNGALTYGVVGRLAPWKGQDFFLRAFARAFPDSDERAVIVGAALFGEDDYADSLPRAASELGIAPRVELRGHRSDVWEELSRIDVLVHSSITPEPFGQVILEGMAAGVPVIAANAGGPAEILEHESTGLLYEPNDTDGLAAALRRMRDPNLRESLSAAARKALDPYAPRVVASELQDLYATVAARGRR